MTSTPIGFAHRGAPPPWMRENTIPAFSRALARGARGLESDVWLTRDGIPVLHHDGVFGPPWLRTRVDGIDAADLPAWLPRLADLYSLCGTGFALSLDMKGADTDAVASAVLAVALEAGGDAVDHLWLCGSVGNMRTWAAWDARLHLANSAAGANLVEPARLAAHLEDLVEAGGHALNLRSRDWQPGMVAATHTRGILAFGWDAQTRRTLRRLVRDGIDGVYCDHVGRLIDEIGRNGSGY